MRLNKFLNEKRTNNVIVVDVQPMYKNYIHFDMNDFCNFLLEQRDILYFYNGPDTVGSDTKEDIIDWLYTESDYNDDLIYKLQHETYFFDKGYAFFRNWMDEGADKGFIKKAIRYMMSKKVYDSREIKTEEWEERFPNDWRDSFENDSINLPDIPLNILKKWSGSYIVGGGKNECLKEIEVLMSVFNIKYKEVRKFIY